MEAWALALVVLFAVLVGASIPVLYQAAATLRAARRTLEEAGPRLERALEATASAAAKVDAVASQLHGAVRVASAVGAAVGPAVGAAVKAFREDRGGPSPPRGTADDGQEVTP
jgi:hypothetical protein